MQRSGSTFAFNVARDVLLARGRVHQEVSGEVAATLARAGGAEHVLMKAHAADALTLALARRGALRTILTVRRVEDAAASWIDTFGSSEAETVEVLRSWLALFAELRGTALVMPYAELDRRPLVAAWRIARYISADVGVIEALRIARQHGKAVVKRRMDALERDGAGVRDIGFSYYDEETYFHRRHVSSLRSRPAEERLPRDQLARISAALAPHIAAAGLSAARSHRASAFGYVRRVLAGGVPGGDDCLPKKG
jgi:hypothetical protein